MINSFDDDTHYCLKCHSTITGLDNYVDHRKSKCGKQVQEAPPPAGLLQPETEEPFALKADDFFSSLELQSSSKKITQSPGGKSFSGILTRSKANAVLQAKDSDNPKNDNSEWILTQDKSLDKHQAKFDESEDDFDYFESDEESSDDEEEDNRHAPPRSFTGGKWKPTSSPVQWLRPQSSQEEDWHASPPAHHTGGKWKPTGTFIKPNEFTPPEHCGGKWKPSTPKENYHIPPPTFTGSKWTPSKVVSKALPTDPPPEHTKGKWKPQALPTESDTPPSTYTKGKWKPTTHVNKIQSLSGKWSNHVNLTKTEISPFRKSSGTVQYWCRPCNRRLASKIVYERHLKSGLHFKRTLNDNEFDDTPYLNLTTNRILDKTHNYCSRTTIKVVENDSNKTQGIRARKKIFVTCDGCGSRVNHQLIGKHLISHYHFRKTDMNRPESKETILQNIHSIILQSPYQCSPCKFYFNTHELFLRHWLSESHKEIVLSSQSFFWCCVCKFKAQSSAVMYDHLLCKEHSEIISVINRSVPVIIKKVCPIKCTECLLEFKLNIELKKHCEKEGHGLENLENYQIRCEFDGCSVVLKSRRALQRHQMLRHKEDLYVCSVCSLNFATRLEAKRHRLTTEHRCAVLERRRSEIGKNCQHCGKKFQNILKLKDHLKEDHPEQHHTCSKCGKEFVIPQDLTVHIRKKACSFENLQNKTKSCDRCPFRTDSASELVFHQVLHTDPLMIYPDDGETSKKSSIAHYKCPVCNKCYPKLSLRCHLRTHTNERPFVCSICNAGFVRRNNLILHTKNHEKKNLEPQPPKKIRKPEEGERLFLCSTCGASFKKRFILQQHMTRHTGKLYNCTKSNCVFSARSQSELKMHLVTHSKDKPFTCKVCDYRGKTKKQLNRHVTMHKGEKRFRCTQCTFNTRLASHLKRHQILHTGTKPFNCPHCSYSCNILENLRKHVLSTNKHPGKCIYECKFCQKEPFNTNFAKDFKVHLLTQHSEQFATGKEANKYVSAIYSSSTKGFVETDKESAQKDDEKTLSQIQDITRKSAIESTILLTHDTSEHHKISEELFPMLIVSKDDNPSELWNIGGNYDVDESGTLVPFHSDRETLLSEHFQ